MRITLGLPRWPAALLLALTSLIIQLPPARANEPPVDGQRPTRRSELYRRIKVKLDRIPAIDTHDHLWPFDKLPGYVETEHGKGMNLYSLWRNSYYSWNHSLTPWKAGGKFEDWWSRARHDFDNARAASFY